MKENSMIDETITTDESVMEELENIANVSEGEHSSPEASVIQQETTSKLTGSPYGVNRKNRRQLYSIVRLGKATENEVSTFRSLGKEAYPWMTFRDTINELKRNSMKRE
jgi:hypothetical protein